MLELIRLRPQWVSCLAKFVRVWMLSKTAEHNKAMQGVRHELAR